jgi:hypothetical protein
MAVEHSDAIGVYAVALLDTQLPWTKMRQVYRLLGLVKKWGAGRVVQACRRALDAEAIDVNLVSRMLERAREEPNPTPDPSLSRCEAASSVTRRSSRRRRRRADDHTTPTVSPELKALMRRVKLGRLLDTLPERLTLARQHDLTHTQFLEQLFSDEVQRRDSDSPDRRSRSAKLVPSMRLEAWDDTGGHHLRPGGVGRAGVDAVRRPGPQRVHPRRTSRRSR